MISREPRSALRIYETDFAFAAGHHAGLPDVAASLREFADQRTLPGGVRAGVDRGRDASEELADCINYLCWQSFSISYVQGPDAEDARSLYLEAAADVIRAYSRLQRARALTPHTPPR